MAIDCRWGFAGRSAGSAAVDEIITLKPNIEPGRSASSIISAPSQARWRRGERLRKSPLKLADKVEPFTRRNNSDSAVPELGHVPC
jgi:hypothetical protein